MCQEKEILKHEKAMSPSIIVLIITIYLSLMNNYLNENIYLLLLSGERSSRAMQDELKGLLGLTLY